PARSAPRAAAPAASAPAVASAAVASASAVDSAADAAAVASARLPQAGLDLKEHLTAIERDLILQALDDSDWVVAHAAKRLAMGRTTLVEKMRKFELQREA
ncbi:MAG: helix-turn-helix domain-containing protein, partial [Gammaproteobacteria bacterium]